MKDQAKNVCWNVKPLKPLDAANFSSISSNGSNHNINLNGSDFSFHKNPDSRRFKPSPYPQINYQSPPQTLRTDLQMLEKQELVELLLEEIEQNKNHRIREKRGNPFAINKCINREEQQNREEEDWMMKYSELAMYMQEYIGNTNEANQQFIEIISKLKEENQYLNSNNSNAKKCESYDTFKCLQCEGLKRQMDGAKEEYEQNIQGLERSLEHYMEINNNMSMKYEKLKILYEKLNQEVENANENMKFYAQDVKCIATVNMSSSYSNFQSRTNRIEGSQSKDASESSYPVSPFCLKEKQNCKTASRLSETNELREKMKLLKIQYCELRDCNQKMQNQLELKSEKIRKLLEEVEKLSEEKWKYKQFYLEHTLCPEKH